jgi:hypothetical protein
MRRAVLPVFLHIFIVCPRFVIAGNLCLACAAQPLPCRVPSLGFAQLLSRWRNASTAGFVAKQWRDRRPRLASATIM